MRILVYGMQSSGASTLAMLLAQNPQCAAFVDIWSMYVAPSLPERGDVLAKVVVTTAYPLELHQERFKPDCTILLLREPQANYRSLATKVYRHHCGFIEEKFKLLDQVFIRGGSFDAVMQYEDLIFDPLGTMQAITQLGWRCEPGFLKLARAGAAIKEFNQCRYPELTDRLQYGTGNFRFDHLTTVFADLAQSVESDGEVETWCPAIVQHYEALARQRGDLWRNAANDYRANSPRS